MSYIDRWSLKARLKKAIGWGRRPLVTPQPENQYFDKILLFCALKVFMRCDFNGAIRDCVKPNMAAILT